MVVSVYRISVWCLGCKAFDFIGKNQHSAAFSIGRQRVRFLGYHELNLSMLREEI